jgi:UDPglucose--hexose-1-phosphate uridylyltransferase
MINIDTPHRRFNPLKDEWVLVSPHREKRPWLGQTEKIADEIRPAYDPKCYLCPGNNRANGEVNPNYTSTFVFTNDFAAILPESNSTDTSTNNLLKYQNIKGECRVICFSPRHDLTMAQMSNSEIENVLTIWTEQFAELSQKYQWVQIFENKGEIMGCSNPHPHGQIWASDFLPNEIHREEILQKKYFEKNNHALLLDYVEIELQTKERIVTENNSWLVVVPFWATWPFETLLLPKKHIRNFIDIDIEAKQDLAKIIKELLRKYDALFETSFPYSMGWHCAPSQNNKHWILHAHYYPPLLRSKAVKKFMVGYEMLAEAQRDLTAEAAAAKLYAL